MEHNKELERLISSMLNHQKMIDFGGEGWGEHINGLEKDKSALLALHNLRNSEIREGGDE